MIECSKKNTKLSEKMLLNKRKRNPDYKQLDPGQGSHFTSSNLTTNIYFIVGDNA